MGKLDAMTDQQFVFGSMHIIANKKETLMERELRENGITFMQWFLMAVIRNSFETAPTLNETARAMGSSHQNVKRIASILEGKGYVRLARDKRDSRVTRIHLTEESGRLAAAIQPRASAFTAALFAGIDPDRMAAARDVMERMMANLAVMEQNEKSTEEE